MKAAVLLLTAATLAACQSAPFVRPDVPVPAAWPHQEGATGDAAATPVKLAEQSWAEIYPVPELTALIDEALVGSSDLRIAFERVELARAQYGLERAASLPAVDLAGTAVRERMPGAHPTDNQIRESWVFALAMPAWEIDLWGRLAARTEAARRDVLANAALAEGVRTSLVAQVSSLYLELLDLDNQLETTRRTLEGRRQALRMTRARFEEGISSILDTRQAESLLASSEQSLADQQRQLAQTQNALAVLIGRNPGPIARSVRLESLPLPAGVMAGMPSELLDRRPDILAAEEALRGAGANLEAARKALPAAAHANHPARLRQSRTQPAVRQRTPGVVDAARRGHTTVRRWQAAIRRRTRRVAATHPRRAIQGDDPASLPRGQRRPGRFRAPQPAT
jgi:outer membrane protein, multidrug efflux system